MKILIAEDDLIPRAMLEHTLREWGHEVIVTADGPSAWEVLQRPDAPALAILDWLMPGLEGPEICRRLRALPRAEPTYVILLTGKHGKGDLVVGLESGADDYITKPFDREELHARLRVGQRIIELQRGLAQQVTELQQALAQVKRLQGLLPICSYCKKVRNDQNYWQQVDTYITEHSEARFSHGICPTCLETVVKQELEEYRAARQREASS